MGDEPAARPLRADEACGGPDLDELQRFRTEMRQFVTGVVIYSQTVAEYVGINSTDLHVLNILTVRGPITAGQLGEATGLTSGAVTHVVDRLAKEGWVRRTSDPRDRRRVMVERLPDPADLHPLFKPMGMRLGRVLMAMSPVERAAVLDFLAAANPLLPEATIALRDEAAEQSKVSTSKSCWRARRGR